MLTHHSVPSPPLSKLGKAPCWQNAAAATLGLRVMKAVQEGESLVHPPAREESSGRAQARYASYLAFNFGASIATIFLGKARRHRRGASLPALSHSSNVSRSANAPHAR